MTKLSNQQQKFLLEARTTSEVYKETHIEYTYY